MTLITNNYIKSLARRVGFSLCGVARAKVLTEHEGALREWLDKGYDGGMKYMQRAPERRANPAALVEGAGTVVVCAVNYKNGAWNQTAAPRIASYAYAPDYHNTIKGMLAEMLAALEDEATASRFNGRAFCDTAPILEKAWAVEAGLGWIGKNSLLVTPEYGSFVLLGVLVLDAECDEYDTPFDGDDENPTRTFSGGIGESQEHTRVDNCGSCTRCIDACPNGAIVAPRVINTNRCISRLTLEKGAPEEGEAGATACVGGLDVRRAIAWSQRANGLARSPQRRNASHSLLDGSTTHGWLAGCDECQSCCPHNFSTPLFTNAKFTPVVPAPAPSDFWSTLTAEQFATLFARTPLVRNGKLSSRAKSRDIIVFVEPPAGNTECSEVE